MIHNNYNKLTVDEKAFVDRAVHNVGVLAKMRGRRLNGSDPAERAVEAIATWVVESREKSLPEYTVSVKDALAEVRRSRRLSNEMERMTLAHDSSSMTDLVWRELDGSGFTGTVPKRNRAGMYAFDVETTQQELHDIEEATGVHMHVTYHERKEAGR